MLLSDLRGATARQARSQVATWAALAGTLALRRKVDEALRTIEAWLGHCARPIVSVSGGKDSTLLLQLVRTVEPSVPAWRADGPDGVYLSDRAAHVAQLAQAASTGPWHVVTYAYDLAGVLAQDVAYPHRLKQRTLVAAMQAARVDGCALGLRAEESRGRQWNVRRRGCLYHNRQTGIWMCTPLARWTASEVIGWLIATDRLPLNPVYARTHLLPDLNRLRDGTWLPNQVSDAEGYRDWIAYHYPEHVADYDLARIALHGGR